MCDLIQTNKVLHVKELLNFTHNYVKWHGVTEYIGSTSVLGNCSSLNCQGSNNTCDLLALYSGENMDIGQCLLVQVSSPEKHVHRLQSSLNNSPSSTEKGHKNLIITWQENKCIVNLNDFTVQLKDFRWLSGYKKHLTATSNSQQFISHKLV